MASKFPEVKLIAAGMQTTAVKDGPAWIQNMWLPEDTWSVRPGFGQVAQIDSTFSLNNHDSIPDYNQSGYREHLGSHLLKTNFGHRQIVSIFKVLAWSASSSVGWISDSPYSDWISTYEVTIYDLETDEYWQEPLYRHTSEGNPDVRSLKYWFANYETKEGSIGGRDRQSWYNLNSTKPMAFAEVNDILFFCNDESGLWSYIPSDFRSRSYEKTRSKQITVIDGPDSDYEPYGESSLVVRVPLSKGRDTDAYGYFTESDVSDIVALTEFLGVLVRGGKNEIFFSDPNFPGSVKDANIQTISTELSITALARQGNTLYIFTESETFMYRPPASGALLSGGELVKISESIGCFSQSAVTYVRGNPVWADRTGIHSAAGVAITTISQIIDNLFVDGISSPLSNFWNNISYPGETIISNNQPQTFFKVPDNPTLVSLSYDENTDNLFADFPDLRMSLVKKSNAGWSIWTYEDIVMTKAGFPEVDAQRNLNSLQMLTYRGDIFAVGGIENTGFLDVTTASRINDRSLYIMELGKGGALDRNVKNEDTRIVKGFHNILRGYLSVFGNHSALHLTKPEVVGGNLKIGCDAVPPSIPGSLEIDPSTVSNVYKLTLCFSYDATHFEPVLLGASTTNIEFELASERLHGIAGWSVFKSDAGVNPLLPDATGPDITIHYDGTLNLALASARNTLPYLNLCIENRNPLCWFKLRPLMNVTTSTNSYGLNWSGAKGHVATFESLNPTVYESTVTAWEQAVRKDLAGGLTVQQSDLSFATVDQYISKQQNINWAYKVKEVGFDEPNQIRTRGIYSKVMSHGRSFTSKLNAWPYGLYNSVFSSDSKEYCGQIIDNTSQANNTPANQRVINKDSLRDRLYDSSAIIMTENVFSGSSSYGETTVPGRGNYIVSDEQIDTISMSDSTRGEYVTTTLFGFVMDKAEALKIGAIDMTYKVISGRRRRGR